MGEKILAILKGMASTMELLPPEVPPIGSIDRAKRLNRSWERTGKAIQHSIDKYSREQASK